MSRIFAHFAFCRRTCDKGVDFCLSCSRAFPTDVVDDLDTFKEILVDNCFDKKFETFFSPKRNYI